jgi:hypothetical protein
VRELQGVLGIDAGEGRPTDEERARVIDAARSEAQSRRLTFLTLALGFEDFFEVAGSCFELDEHDAKSARPYLEILADLGYEVSWIEAKFVGLPYEEPQMPGTASPATEEGASDAEAGGDSPTSDEGTKPISDEVPEILISAKRGKFYSSCSACGHVGINTKMDVAQERVRIHLKEQHGIEAAA